MATWGIQRIAEQAWHDTWEWGSAPVFPGTFEQYKMLKEKFLENLGRRLALGIDQARKRQSSYRGRKIEQTKSRICGFCDGKGYHVAYYALDPTEDLYAVCPFCRYTGGNMTTVPVTVEEINAKLENSVKEDMSYADFAHGEYGPDGEIIDVHTPWACGFTEKEEYIADF